ncbi:MAG: hypothetical protein K2Q22_00920, partial [Cytophagales bacterium]|nr:hypothetical protein [Cytophagales bacterium]
DWLKIELAKCKAKQKRFDPSQLQIFSSKTKKLEMNLSVAQIAYFFRLLNGANIIANKVKKDIFTVIINNFSSQKVETIELSSLRNKFYYAETKTIESVKDMLKTLLKEADKPDDPTFLLEQ